VSWQLFERAAAGYQSWYETPRGRRIVEAEQGLLAWLLAALPGARSVLEVGCGTGQFTRWLAAQGYRPLGLDRSPAMLEELRRRGPEIPALIGDGLCLPFGDLSVDLVLHATCLEFVPDPLQALREAVRVSRRGVVLLVMNRASLGGLSRRIGPQSRRPLLSQARDVCRSDLERQALQAAGGRSASIRWAGTLFPWPFRQRRGRLPLGDVIGMAMVLGDVRTAARGSSLASRDQP
jgi:SAM-dependent methyltransferase